MSLTLSPTASSRSKVELTGVAKGLFDESLVVRPLVVGEGHEVAPGSACGWRRAPRRASGASTSNPGQCGLHPDGRERITLRRSRFLDAETVPGPLGLRCRYSCQARALSRWPTRQPARRARRQGEPPLRRKVVRKDLVRKVKVGANVPVFVLEFLLGKYCASSDEVAIQMGLQVVNDTLANNYIRPDESMKAQSKVKENGKLHLHRQGEGPARRFRLLGRGAQFRQQVSSTSRRTMSATTSAC